MYVTEVEPQQVENCEPYVLFYRKQQRQMPAIRARAVELMQHREKSLMQFIISKQWINKFNTFAEPGSITNEDFLCAHGGFHTQLFKINGDLCRRFCYSLARNPLLLLCNLRSPPSPAAARG